MPAFAAQRLLPAEGRDIDLVPVDVVGEHRAGRVGEAQALAVVRNPVAVGNAHARGGAVPGEQHVVRPVDLAEVGKLAVIGADDGRVELQLLDRIGHPAFAEALPGEAGDRPGAEHRPHRHFERAGVGPGDDADAVSVGQLEHLAHQVDAELQPLLAEAAAMRPAEHLRVSSLSGLQPGGLAQGPDEKYGRAGRTWRLVNHSISPHREHAPRWDGVARRRI